jgi:hypothetical protein
VVLVSRARSRRDRRGNSQQQGGDEIRRDQAAGLPRILDRGMGKAPQSLSLLLEGALDKSLHGMSLEELEAVREQSVRWIPRRRHCLNI